MLEEERGERVVQVLFLSARANKKIAEKARRLRVPGEKERKTKFVCLPMRSRRGEKGVRTGHVTTPSSGRVQIKGERLFLLTLPPEKGKKKQECSDLYPDSTLPGKEEGKTLCLTSKKRGGEEREISLVTAAGKGEEGKQIFSIPAEEEERYRPAKKVP